MSDEPPSCCATCGKSETELPEGARLLLCGRCRTVNYCNKECQFVAWKEHRKTCRAPPQNGQDSNNQSTSGSERKQIILITLEDFSWLDDVYKTFYDMMRASCDFIQVKKASDAVNKINTTPDAVILFEPSVMNKAKRNRNQTLNNALVSYTKAGGTVIFGCQCSANVTPPNVGWYFTTLWDLPWKTGDYARYDFEPGPGVRAINGKTLKGEYNVKALQLENVDQDAVVYHVRGAAQGLLAQMAAQGMLDFDPHGPNPGGNAGPVIWKKYESGWVAWLGDVNNEVETREIMMMMCRL